MHPRCSVGCEANESPDWIRRSPAVHFSRLDMCSLVKPGARGQQAMRARSHDRRRMRPRCPGGESGERITRRGPETGCPAVHPSRLNMWRAIGSSCRACGGSPDLAAVTGAREVRWWCFFLMSCLRTLRKRRVLFFSPGGGC